MKGAIKTTHLSCHILLLFFMFGISSCSSQPKETAVESQLEDVYGNWFVSGFGFYPITIYEEGEAEREYLGRSILIDSELTIILGDTCIKPRINSSVVDLNIYYNERSRMSKEELGLQEDSALIVELYCTEMEVNRSEKSMPDYTFIYAGKSLSLVQEGALFHLSKKMMMYCPLGYTFVASGSSSLRQHQ